MQFKYPELTPFQYASNRPITGVDLDGFEFYVNTEGKITGKGSEENCKNVYYVDKYNEKGSPENYYDLNVTIEEYAGFASLVWNESSGNKEESLGIANAVANYVSEGGSSQIKTIHDIVVKANYYSSAVLQQEANEYSNAITNRYELESVLNALMRISYPKDNRFKDNTNGSTHWDGVDLVVGLKKKGECANQDHRNYKWSADSKDLLKKFYTSFSVSEKNLNNDDIAFNTSVYVWNWHYLNKNAEIKAIKILGKTLFEKVKNPGEGFNSKYPKKIDYRAAVSKKLNIDE